MPEVGRFVSEDPFDGRIGQPLSHNAFIYCQNNTFKYIDPSGFEPNVKVTTGNPVKVPKPEIKNFERGVTFFHEKFAVFYESPASILGSEGGLTYFMPLEDASVVTSVFLAAKETGMAKSVEQAYVNNERVFGISFPIKDLEVRQPTQKDANGWSHYLEGGRTAIRGGDDKTGFYLVNDTKEFVTPGGKPMPKGSVLFVVNNNGSWSKVREW